MTAAVVGREPAIENGVVEVSGDRPRFTHPLLSSAVYQKISLVRRRELHARLATIVRDPEERARHLALSVEGQDVTVAAALEEAASLAGSRGAPQSAAELWEMARPSHPAGPRRGPGPGGRLSGRAEWTRARTSRLVIRARGTTQGPP